MCKDRSVETKRRRKKRRKKEEKYVTDRQHIRVWKTLNRVNKRKRKRRKRKKEKKGESPTHVKKGKKEKSPTHVKKEKKKKSRVVHDLELLRYVVRCAIE